MFGWQCLRMRWIILLTALTAQASAAPFDSARVDAPFSDIRALLEAGAVKKPPLPVESAVLSARYDVGFGDGFVSGKAAFDVQTFQDGEHLVPLFSEKVSIESVAPDDAVIVRSGKSHALVVEGRRRVRVTLGFNVPVEKGEANLSVGFGVAPAAIASLKVSNVSDPLRFRLEGGCLRGDTWFLGGADSIRMEVSTAADPKVALALPAIVSLMSSAMRVVRDGALYNAMSWHVRHQGAVDFKLEMPPDIQFVAFTVGGRPALPATVDGRHVEIHLPELKENAAETVVGFSYTSHKPAFAPVRGELALELPSTPLLVEKSEWQVSLPDGFEPIAIDGNVECERSKEPGIVRLRKDISTGEAPALRLFYQKPETYKK